MVLRGTEANLKIAVDFREIYCYLEAPRKCYLRGSISRKSTVWCTRLSVHPGRFLSQARLHTATRRAGHYASRASGLRPGDRDEKRRWQCIPPTRLQHRRGRTRVHHRRPAWRDGSGRHSRRRGRCHAARGQAWSLRRWRQRRRRNRNRAQEPHRSRRRRRLRKHLLQQRRDLRLTLLQGQKTVDNRLSKCLDRSHVRASLRMRRRSAWAVIQHRHRRWSGSLVRMRGMDRPLVGRQPLHILRRLGRLAIALEVRTLAPPAVNRPTIAGVEHIGTRKS